MLNLLENHCCDNTLLNMKHIFVINSSIVTGISTDNLNSSDNTDSGSASDRVWNISVSAHIVKSAMTGMPPSLSLLVVYFCSSFLTIGVFMSSSIQMKVSLRASLQSQSL